MPPYDIPSRKRIDATVLRVEATPGDISSAPDPSRSPYSQRPAQFQNNAGETIPAYGCIKIEDGSKYAIGPGVPFFLATKPASTLLTDRFAINGSRPIDSGDHGECYLSGHTRALYNTGTPVAGNAYGPTPGQWYLTKDYPPIFRVATIANVANQHAYGWLHPIELLRFELKDDMPSSGSVTANQFATAYFLKEDDTIVTAIEFEVTDVRGIYRGRGYVSSEVRGSQGYAKFMPDSGVWEILSMTPHAHRISGDAGSEVTATTTQFTMSGTAVIMNPPGAIVQVDPTGANLMKNPLGLVFASGDTFHAEWNEHHAVAPQWEVVVPSSHQATWLQFTASADFLTGGAITIDARTYFDGFDPGTPITSILNPLNLTGYDNVVGIAHINTNVTPPTYTAFNVAPVAEDVLTDFNVDTSLFKLQKKTRPISIMPRGDETAFVDIHTGTDCA